MSLCYWYLISPCSWTSFLRTASFRGTDCSDTTRQQTLQGTTRPTTAGCRSSDVSMPLGSSWHAMERFQVGWKCGCGLKWKENHGEKKVFVGSALKNAETFRRISALTTPTSETFAYGPGMQLCLRSHSQSHWDQIAPLIVIMFSFDPRSPCPSPSDIEVVSPRTWHLSWRSTKVHWHSPSSPPRAPTSPSGSMRRLGRSGTRNHSDNSSSEKVVFKQTRFLQIPVVSLCFTSVRTLGFLRCSRTPSTFLEPETAGYQATGQPKMHLDPVTGMQERSVWPVWPGWPAMTCNGKAQSPWLSHGYLKPSSHFSGLPDDKPPCHLQTASQIPPSHILKMYSIDRLRIFNYPMLVDGNEFISRSRKIWILMLANK